MAIRSDSPNDNKTDISREFPKIASESRRDEMIARHTSSFDEQSEDVKVRRQVNEGQVRSPKQGSTRDVVLSAQLAKALREHKLA